MEIVIKSVSECHQSLPHRRCNNISTYLFFSSLCARSHMAHAYACSGGTDTCGEENMRTRRRPARSGQYVVDGETHMVHACAHAAIAGITEFIYIYIYIYTGVSVSSSAEQSISKRRHACMEHHRSLVCIFIYRRQPNSTRDYCTFQLVYMRLFSTKTAQDLAKIPLF